jgi:hypothetical protein
VGELKQGMIGMGSTKMNAILKFSAMCLLTFFLSAA